jgi:hypothetical protein
MHDPGDQGFGLAGDGDRQFDDQTRPRLKPAAHDEANPRGGHVPNRSGPAELVVTSGYNRQADSRHGALHAFPDAKFDAGRG